MIQRIAAAGVGAAALAVSGLVAASSGPAAAATTVVQPSPTSLTAATDSSYPKPVEGTCSPVTSNRPICPQGADLAQASFLDPTATVQNEDAIRLSAQVYVGPFAQLSAVGGEITVGPESNLQDNTRVLVTGTATAAQLAQVDLKPGDGVVTGERMILAHGATIKGPARIGVGPVVQVDDGHGGQVADSGVFISFGAEVDGAVLERDSGLSALARVGPGVRLRTGLIVIAGKNVTTQAEADDPRLGKVRPITEVDRDFNEEVVHVNRGLAAEYSKLARESLGNVTGINLDPAGTDFDSERNLPHVEGELCTGPTVRNPAFRNRLIGDICFEDTARGLDRKLGSSISMRSDEGGPFEVGVIRSMDDGATFHALEGTDLRVGDRVRYGKRVILHGGGRPQIDVRTGLSAPTLVGNDVTIGDESVVFRSLIRNGSVIGRRSIVVGSQLDLKQRIPAGIVYANDGVAGTVEW